MLHMSCKPNFYSNKICKKKSSVQFSWKGVPAKVAVKIYKFAQETYSGTQ